MNIRVEAGSLNISLSATLVEPTCKVKIVWAVDNISCSTWTCFTLIPSINGHSLSGVNPELSLIGGMATSVMA